jgi:hypothetical protein
MSKSVIRSLATLVRLTIRALWRGTISTRLLALSAIVVVVLLASQAGLHAVSQLAGAGLLLALFVIVYSLILRGH